MENVKCSDFNCILCPVSVLTANQQPFLKRVPNSPSFPVISVCLLFCLPGLICRQWKPVKAMLLDSQHVNIGCWSFLKRRHNKKSSCHSWDYHTAGLQVSRGVVQESQQNDFYIKIIGKKKNGVKLMSSWSNCSILMDSVEL